MRPWPSLTAEGVCLARALEHRRDDRLVHDPHALGFLRAPARALVHSAATAGPAADLAERGFDPGLVASIGARHGWIDERLAAAAPSASQVLLLGAGYDSRAWRLPLAHAIVVELDHPATARRKARRVRRQGLPADARQVITADLAAQSLADVLARSVLRPDTPTVVVWEGVSMYLPEAAVERTLSALSLHFGPDLVLLMDLWTTTATPLHLAAAERAGRAGLRVLGEPLRFELPPLAIAGWMERRGFRVVRHSDTDTVARLRAGRPAFPPLQLVEATPIPGRAS